MNHSRPNIVLIMADQWRGDCLGIAGHPVVETPNLDSIFRQGTAFTRAHSSVPSCIAARAALLTGLSQRSHGRVGYQDGVNWNYPTTLPGLLADAGYHTHCAGKMHVHPPRSLMGFHNVDLHDHLGHLRNGGLDYSLFDDYLPWLQDHCGRDAEFKDSGLGSNGYSVNSWPYEERFHPTNWVTTKAIDFLRRRDVTKPFFLKVSYHRPHPPLDPPQNYLNRYLNKELPPVAMGDWSSSQPLTQRGPSCPVPDSSDQMDLARKAYYAQITHIDCQINRLVQALFERQVWNDTMLIFLADHGEMLYDHNFVGKSVPYAGAAGIPFMIRLPDAWETAQTRRSDALVELRDVLPTCLDVAGIPFPDSIEGASVVPLCRGEDVSWRDYLHGEHSSPLAERANQWIINDKELYVWNTQNGAERYFRLDSDQCESCDTSKEHPDRVEFLRRRLITELDGREEGYVKNGELVVGTKYQAVLDSTNQE